MSSTIGLIKRFYRENFVETRDSRNADWFLLGNPLPIILILTFYLYFTLNLGQKLMRDRKPFILKEIIIVYNTIQVLANLVIVCVSIYISWKWNYEFFKCKGPDRTNSAVGKIEIYLCYGYFLLKVLDLLDTIFFVLRKKQNQITHLHVYHHVVLVTVSYAAASYFPGGTISVIGVINAFVHVVMYYYYTVALITQKEQWWKKYITRLQLFQFAVLLIHSTNILRQGDCNGSFYWMLSLFLQSSYFTYLFASFYIKSYIKTKKNI